MQPHGTRPMTLGAVTLACALGATAAYRTKHSHPLHPPLVTSPARAERAHARARSHEAQLVVTPPRAACLTPGSPEASLHGVTLAGGTIAASPSGPVAAVVDTEGDSVALLALDASQPRVLRTFPVGRGPAQVALASDGRVFVTERFANTVSVYDAATGQRLCSTSVTADPFGISVSNGVVYVSSGLGQTLTALGADTLRVLDSTPVPREPRGVSVDPTRGLVLLAHLAGQPLSAWAFSRGRLGPVTLPAVPITPEVRTFAFFSRPPHLRGDFEENIFTPPDVATPLEKPTGSREFVTEPTPATPVAQRGARMIFSPRHRFRRPPPPPPRVTRPIPSQAWSVVVDPSASEAHVAFMLNRTGREIPKFERRDAYGGGSFSAGPEPEKITFAVATLNLATLRWTRTATPEGSFPSSPTRPRVRIPTSVIVRPDGSLAVTSMGSNAVASLTRRGAQLVEVDSRATVAAPCGMVHMRDGTEVVYSQLSHSVEVKRGSSTHTLAVGRETLAADVVRGRALFHTANDPRISSGGLSCGGCHPDARDDGLVWFLSQGPRQTPTLAGRLEGPFNWNGTATTMAENVRQTVRRLGGRGLPDDDVNAIVAYLFRGIRAPEPASFTVRSAAETASIARGRELFDNDAACSACHAQEHNFTDGHTHVFGGMSSDETRRTFDTPSLRYVAHTAPYFHDGRYATLRALLRDPQHHMGHSADLSLADISALESYLRTL